MAGFEFLKFTTHCFSICINIDTLWLSRHPGLVERWPRYGHVRERVPWPGKPVGWVQSVAGLLPCLCIPLVGTAKILKEASGPYGPYGGSGTPTAYNWPDKDTRTFLGRSGDSR